MKFGEAYGVAVDSVMCTAACPCKKADEAAWTEMTAADLAAFNRKGIVNDVSEAGDDPTQALPLLFVDPAENADLKTYDTWYACYEDLQKEQGEQTEEQ